jgi:hypothetical protein
MRDFNLYGGLISLLSRPSPYVRLGNHHHVVPCPLRFARGECTWEKNPCLLSLHDVPSVGLGAPPIRGMCLDTALRPIRLDTCAFHDVVVWCYLTVFCQPTSIVGYQVGSTHDFHLTGRSGRPSIYGADRPRIRMPGRASR